MPLKGGMKGFQKGFSESGGSNDPIMKAIGGLFSSSDSSDKPNAQQEAIKRKKQMQKDYQTE